MNATAKLTSAGAATVQSTAADGEALAELLKEWEFTAPFRESALAYLPAKIARMLQYLGSWLLDIYIEASLKPVPTFRRSACRYRLRTVVSDLDYTAHALADLYEELSDPHSSDHDESLGQCCASAALRVRELAEALGLTVASLKRRANGAI